MARVETQQFFLSLTGGARIEAGAVPALDRPGGEAHLHAMLDDTEVYSMIRKDMGIERYLTSIALYPES